MFCCQEAKCPGGGILPDSPTACSDDSDCSDGKQCIKSVNVPGVSTCCFAENVVSLPDAPVIQTRCLGRSTLLLMGNPVSCSSNSGCQDAYECSTHTTHGESICCAKLQFELRYCPDNRNPLRDAAADHPISCDLTSCPGKAVCKKSPTDGKNYCCSHIAFCPANMQPQLDAQTMHAKRCYGGGCPPGFSCVESSVNEVHVCCRMSLNNDAPITPLPPPSSDPWVVLDG